METQLTALNWFNKSAIICDDSSNCEDKLSKMCKRKTKIDWNRFQQIVLWKLHNILIFMETRIMIGDSADSGAKNTGLGQQQHVLCEIGMSL